MSTLPELAADQNWFSFEELPNGITRITEPYVDDYMQANMWLIRGSTYDLLIDAGNGIASLAHAIAHLNPHNLIMLATHAHADHVGSLHEFENVWCHEVIADALERNDPDATLADPTYAIDNLTGLICEPRLEGNLAKAKPHNYNPKTFGPKPTKISRRLKDGDPIDLGNRKFEVLHLPGHSPGCIGLYDAASKLLIAGDVVYDGKLLDELHHSNKTTYAASLRRVLQLDAETILAGHGDPFGAAQLKTFVANYLAR